MRRRNKHSLLNRKLFLCKKLGSPERTSTSVPCGVLSSVGGRSIRRRQVPTASSTTVFFEPQS